MRVLPIHFGVVLGCKGGGGRKKQLGPEKFFQAQAAAQAFRDKAAQARQAKTSQEKPRAASKVR